MGIARWCPATIVLTALPCTIKFEGIIVKPVVLCMLSMLLVWYEAYQTVKAAASCSLQFFKSDSVSLSHLSCSAAVLMSEK